MSHTSGFFLPPSSDVYIVLISKKSFLKKICRVFTLHLSPGGSDGKELACNAGQLAGCSPWGHKELDTTEGLSTAQHM